MNQRSNSIVMIRPAAFGFNPETAGSNTFQTPSLLPVRQKALTEFNAVLQRLQQRGLTVISFDDLPGSQLPDSVFPNNWISMHHDGTVVLYPMATPSRRAERRSDIPEMLENQFGFRITRTVDLTQNENSGHYLEGTGSVVFDHIGRKAWMSDSVRSNRKVLEELCHLLGYEPFVFNTASPDRIPVYHTNVVMSLGTSFAVLCTDVIPQEQRSFIIEQLEKGHRQVIPVSGAQMAEFCANILETEDPNGDPVIVISDTAIKAFGHAGIRQLEKYGDLLTVTIPTIEKTGGGGIRCMIAENFLPLQSEEVRVVKAQDQPMAEACYDLRWRVLRAPWSQPRGSEKDDLDGLVIMAAALSPQGKVIGTGRLQQLDPGTSQIRYMAVDPDWQGKGVGKAVVRFLEAEALKNGAGTMILQARDNAVNFYLANGYEIAEKSFLLYDVIQHFLMKKKLR